MAFFFHPYGFIPYRSIGFTTASFFSTPRPTDRLRKSLPGKAKPSVSNSKTNAQVPYSCQAISGKYIDSLRHVESCCAFANCPPLVNPLVSFFSA